MLWRVKWIVESNDQICSRGFTNKGQTREAGQIWRECADKLPWASGGWEEKLFLWNPVALGAQLWRALNLLSSPWNLPDLWPHEDTAVVDFSVPQHNKERTQSKVSVEIMKEKGERKQINLTKQISFRYLFY
jgi:hypothetical protein